MKKTSEEKQASTNPIIRSKKLANMKLKESQKKGQSAIEYLTTYGWMLLVIAIVGGAIFTTVQNSAQIQSVSGLNNADVQVSDYGVNQDGLQLSLRAAAQDQVNIQKIEITDPKTGITSEISPSEVVSIGSTSTVELKDVKSSETTKTHNLKITYDAGGLENLKAEGRIAGSIDVFNRIELVRALFNRSTNKLQIELENNGDNQTESINYTIQSNNTEYTGNLPNLSPGQKTQINISTDETYPLKSISLDVEGFQFIDSHSEMKCTPTKGLIGYWTFNQEHTTNNITLDLSGYGNDGSIDSAESVEGQVGEALRFNDGDTVDMGEPGFSAKIKTVFFFVRSSEKGSNWNTIASWAVINDQGNQDARTELDGGYERLYTRWITDPAGDGNSLNDGGSWSRPRSQNYDNDQWHQYASTFDGNEIVEYWNGEVFSSNDGYNTNIAETKPDGYLRFNPSFNLQAEEFRIYNRSLSRSEIERLYQVRSEDWAVSGCKLTS